MERILDPICIVSAWVADNDKKEDLPGVNIVDEINVMFLVLLDRAFLRVLYLLWHDGEVGKGDDRLTDKIQGLLN